MNVRTLEPLARVASVPASIAFYAKLGFEVVNSVGGGEPTWAYLRSGNASLMLGKASLPIDAAQQAVLFYLNVDDVEAAHAELAANGLNVGDIAQPFYAPRGEFRVVDPDGYVLMITHT